jgi:hypothetical protein
MNEITKPNSKRNSKSYKISFGKTKTQRRQKKTSKRSGKVKYFQALYVSDFTIQDKVKKFNQGNPTRRERGSRYPAQGLRLSMGATGTRKLLLLARQGQLPSSVI